MRSFVTTTLAYTVCKKERLSDYSLVGCFMRLLTCRIILVMASNAEWIMVTEVSGEPDVCASYIIIIVHKDWDLLFH